MAVPAGARDRAKLTRAAATYLSKTAFERAVRLTSDQMQTLDDMARGRVPRNAGAILGALRLKTEWAYPRPVAEHALSGDVRIIVQTSIPGSPGAGVGLDCPPTAHGALPAPTPEVEMCPDVELIAPSEVLPAFSVRDQSTPDERRAQARAEWLEDERVHPPQDGA